MMDRNTLRRFIVTLVGPLRARVDTMVQRVVVKAIDDASKAQQLTVTALAGDDGDEVEHCQPFGLSFRPTAGAEGVALSIGGESAYRVVLGVQDRNKRPAADVNAGEGGLYLDGVYRVFIADDGTVHLGEQSAADFVALAAKTDREFDRVWDALTGFTPVANDGGAALKTFANTLPFKPSVQSVAATKAKAT